MTSKYSALPDIDDQPDVYETPDVSEENPMTSFDDQESDDANENLIKTRVSMKEATGRFSNSVVIADDTDFSDRLSRRKKAMYRTFVRRPPGLETSEYELLPKDMALEETSLQKLRRLMFEVQELTEHIEKKVRRHKRGLVLPCFLSTVSMDKAPIEHTAYTCDK
ncbi:Dynamitin-domain-containing protein [Spinellus fusiger]|nr:Dynamitin-domain-containing protein [Spinellus fusiger]